MAKNKRDLLSIAYDKTGEMFRRSPYGIALRFAITNDLTKTARDKLLSKFPEHHKRFAQYLTGGTVGNKDITWLPDHIKQDIIKAHQLNQYPEREKFITKGSTKGKLNPKYNPNSNLLSTWNQGHDENFQPHISTETTYSLGHVQFIPDGKGGYTMTDVYDVDPNQELGDEPYKRLRSTRSDLVEGGQLASRLDDFANFLGINKPMKFNVKFNREDLQINQ